MLEAMPSSADEPRIYKYSRIFKNRSKLSVEGNQLEYHGREITKKVNLFLGK
jgi:hypothetical protein